MDTLDHRSEQAMLSIDGVPSYPRNALLSIVLVVVVVVVILFEDLAAYYLSLQSAVLIDDVALIFHALNAPQRDVRDDRDCDASQFSREAHDSAELFDIVPEALAVLAVFAVELAAE